MNNYLQSPRILRLLLASALGWLVVPVLWAQQGYSAFCVKPIDARLCTQQIDSFSILPPVEIYSDSTLSFALDARFFKLNNNVLLIDTAALHNHCPNCARLFVRYRRLPIQLATPYSRLDPARVAKLTQNKAIEFDYNPYNTPTPLINSAQMHSSGAYTRGLSFGNTQNLVFNSNLNLQLEGQLGKDLELRAAISDNSIPLQPDGSTRQLQEFDQVYIQLKKNKTVLTAGDFDLQRPSTSYFSNYFKRLQGASVQSPVWTAPHDTVLVRTAAAVSKGKFARQIIQGQEGNQGPYRLQGAEGERFIIVLAGTEKVYVDGSPMQRGATDDYVIDYNLGEITFTQKRPINKDSRIIVEFEYAVQAYLRSTLAADVTWRHQQNQQYYFNLYSEQDGKNSSGIQELTPAERQALAFAGDALSQAYASGIDTLSTPYDAGRVQYKQVDTLVCGVLQSILVYSNNPDSALYTARFTEVSPGQGNYILAQSAANGRVYQWIAPDPISCQPKGNFEPIVRLQAPEMRQLYTMGANINAGKKQSLRTEIALSNRDLNRFSPLNDRDNIGLGAFAEWQRQMLSTPKWAIQTNAVYEFAGHNFRTLNPYRSAEFQRDWNLDKSTASAPEHLGKASIVLEKKQLGKLLYAFNTFNRIQEYNGRRHFAQLQLQKRDYSLQAESNLLQSDARSEKTNFARSKMDVGKTFFKQDSSTRKALFKFGLYGEQELNRRFSAGSDTLSPSSFRFDLGRIYLQTPERSKTWQLGASYQLRNDYLPVQQQFLNHTRAREINLNGQWFPASDKNKQQLQWNLTWRKLKILEPEYTALEAQNTYLGRVDYSLSTLKNALTLSTGYELGSGQSPKLEYNYLLVNPGEGQFTWIDRNQDSTLQVDEMEIAVFQDQANYIRVAVNSTTYVRTNNTAFNQNIRFDPRLLWGRSQSRWLKGVSRLSTLSTLQINRRVYADAQGSESWNPFTLNITDTLLVNATAGIRNALFIQRGDPKWDASIEQSDNRSRLQVSTGFESRDVSDWTLRSRVNPGKKWSIEASALRGRKSSEAQNFSNRNYTILRYGAGPKLNFLPTRTLRLAAEYKWQKAQNQIPGAEHALQHTLSAEMSWNPRSQARDDGFSAASAIRAKLSYAQIEYSGQANTAVAYAMLEGLQNGRNLLWSLNIDRQLSKTMQLNLQYEGRKTGTGRMVHVARAQVRALF